MDSPGDGDIQKDDVLFGRYRVCGFLGRGAFGQVYLVEHLKLKVNRALKCIDKCCDPYNTARREADILKNLRHPAIPIIYDIEESEESVYIIEEYVQGVSLQSLISQNRNFTVREVIGLTLRLCDILKYLHSNGIFHNDIKPDNILYDTNTLKLIDYGSAKEADSVSGFRMGTKGFAAPEMYGNGRLGAESDVYSIGVVMLVLLTGGMDIKALEAVHPHSMADIVTACLFHSGNERISTVTGLEKRLRALQNKKFISENVSLHIGFAGAYTGCGTTHTALMAAEYFKCKGYKTVLIERNNSGDFFELIKAAKYIAFNKGIYTADGIDMIPEYNGCVDVDMEKGYQRIICDCGVLDNDNIELLAKYDIVCLVCGASSWRIKKTIEAARLMKSCVKDSNAGIYTLVTPGKIRDYRRLATDGNIVNPIRVPYRP